MMTGIATYPNVRNCFVSSNWFQIKQSKNNKCIWTDNKIEERRVEMRENIQYPSINGLIVVKPGVYTYMSKYAELDNIFDVLQFKVNNFWPNTNIVWDVDMEMDALVMTINSNLIDYDENFEKYEIFQHDTIKERFLNGWRILLDIICN